MSSPATVAVTGAAGFVGRHVCRALLERGHRVIAVVRSGSDRAVPPDLQERVESRPADIALRPSLDSALQGSKAVVHAAAFVSIDGQPWEEAKRTNLVGTRNVLQACLDNGIGKLVHVSSVHAFTRMRRIELNRNAPLWSDSRIPYPATKAGAHAEVLRAMSQGRIGGAIICPAVILGPDDDRPTISGKTLLDVARGHIPMMIDQGYWWTDVRDVADAISQAVCVEGSEAPEQGGHGNVYFTAGRYAQLGRLAEICSDVLGRDLTRPTVPYAAAVAGLPFIRAYAALRSLTPLYTREALTLIRNCPGRVDHRGASIDLGYAPRPTEETVRDAVVSFRENGLLE